MFNRKGFLVILIALITALSALLPSAFAAETAEARDPQWQWSDVRRVVVIPDVHGAYDALVRLLQATDIIDADLGWAGGDAHLVSLGDLLDRGSDSRAVMDLLMRLEEEAPRAGGRVHVVLGNHEQMNLVGDLRYVSAGEYLAFAGDETADMLDKARSDFATANPGLSSEELTAAFADRYPPGYFAHREAFRTTGRYGRWLLSLPTIIVVNDTAFVHGGLPRITAGWTAGQLNRTFLDDLKRYLEVWQQLVARGAIENDPSGTLEPSVADEWIENPSTCVEDRVAACEMIEGNDELQALIDEFGRLSGSLVNGYEAPFWYRGSVYCRDILERPLLDEYLHVLNAERVVVGHTPTVDRRVRSIRDGKVIMTDTGMLASYYKGRPAALVMERGTLLVHYLDPAEQSVPLTGFGPVAYGLEQARLERALTEGDIIAVNKENGESSWSVTLEFEGKDIEARFFRGGRRGTATQELAAYALDSLLGTELVAATASRKVDDTEGALQLVYPREISEQARLEANLGFDGGCPMQDQFQLMYLYDLLTANRGRSAENIRYTPGDWNLRLSDHGLAFNQSRKLPPSLSDDAIVLAPAVAAALAHLDQARLDEALGDYLDKRRIRALLARRDAILEKFGN